MHKKSGVILIAVGAALIISALSLFIYNRHQDAQAGEAAKSLLAEMHSVMQKGHEVTRKPKPVVISAENAPDETEKDAAKEDMAVAKIGGYDCIGAILIPALGLELPVISEWNYKRLTIAPCRQFGSPKTDDLVIVGHNYTNHFRRLSSLKPGDEVIFTDLDGEVNSYEVTAVNTLAATAVEAVRESGHDLVIYTCNYSGKARVTVFCDRKM